MSHLNKPQIDQSFSEIKKILKGCVPPCVAEIDTPTHYECIADKSGEKILFAYVVAHSHVVTMGFNNSIPLDDKKQIFSERLLKSIQEFHGRIEIKNVFDHDLSDDIRESITKLMYYYTDKGWA